VRFLFLQTLQSAYLQYASARDAGKHLTTLGKLLSITKGNLLEGCRICLTGLVSTSDSKTLQQLFISKQILALGGVVESYGACFCTLD
jgi:hypothetical protein